MATAVIEVPHVYKAWFEIMKAVKVDKTGKLPTNLGGKNYAPAPAVAEEVKNQLAANDLIMVSRETVVAQESIINKDRIVIRVVVVGSYEVVSIQDGSSFTMSGTGDGIATATAVASNIASTNAQKNALLRNLMISEQAVEDASHAGVTEGKKDPTSRALDKARSTSTAPKQPGKTAQDIIRDDYIEAGVITKTQATEMVKQVKDEQGLSGMEAFDAVLKKLKAGEVG